MHYFACVELPGFYVANLLEVETDLARREVFVHRNRTVWDASPLAADAGVRLGMPLAEAKLLVPEGVVRPYDEETYRPAWRAWMDACLDFADGVESADPHLGFLDLSAHPDPSFVAVALGRCLVARGHRVRIGVGPSKWVARLIADVAPWVGDPDANLAQPREKAPDTFLRRTLWDGLQIDPPRRVQGAESTLAWTLRTDDLFRDPALFLAGQPVERLLPATDAERERLVFLGYRTFAEVANLPDRTLRKQFGERGTLLRAAALGKWSEALRPDYPEASLVRSLRCEGPVSDGEVLKVCLRRLADTVAQGLFESDRQGASLTLVLELEDGTSERRERTFAKPLRSPASLLMALSLLADPAPETPIVALRAILPDLRPAERRQTNLNGLYVASERAAGSDEAMRQIRGVFGDGAIRLAREVEVTRRQRLLQAWKHATGWA
ncbi:MAG: hypothetical protein KIS66_08940 [Fimbriimonadaceae bacterium]|nr:hypothetical protein [Fimbriimonadaceae bacterium]